MYLKLTLRNAKRSMLDYLLYISSMVMLTSIIFLSNCIADWGDMEAGFQTVALPLLIVIIMAVLVNYINHFIIRQRAKEFAIYMLLGMEKDKLSLVFLCELSVIGLVCFLLGVTLGTGIFSICCHTLLLETGSRSILRIILKSVLQTFVYFCCVEVLSTFFMKHKIYKLQVVQLMREKQRNQPLGTGKKSFWGWMLIISFSGYLALLSGISFMPGEIMSVSISLISLPMLICVFSFYRWLYAFIASLRLSQADALYQGNRLYQIAEMTSGSKTSANVNTIFCICFIFSAAAFVFGTFLLNPNIFIFEKTQQQWMGFLQISICIIFMIIYFSVLSLLQIIDLKKENRNMRLLFHMGKNQSDLKYLICTQVLIKLFMPILMSFIILWTAAPFVNYKMNSILHVRNHLFKAIGGFMVCFFVLYLCYFGVVYIISTRYIKLSTKE
ncbi:MAG: FtsX-like permease family protein [Lachnospiraceae bacterium]|nr:FtsX-like permease family protein [Lachnospiraceae bacterium]